MTDESLSHVDASGKLRMVDVSDKDQTARTARARCVIVTHVALSSLGVTEFGLDALQWARLTGIQAAKSTSDLIPLCHPLNLTNIQVEVQPHSQGFEVHAEVSTIGRTGVEMEALTACGYCAVALLHTLQGIDPRAAMVDLEVVSKSGGKSDWGRDVVTPS